MSLQDTYILRKLLSKQPISEADYVSPVMRLLIGALNPSSDIGWKRLHQAVVSDTALLEDVMRHDPTEPLTTQMIPRVVQADDLGNIKKPDYLVPEYAIFDRSINALVGGSGSGKSFIALDFAAKLASNLSGESVVYLAAEGLASFPGRWEAWKKHHQKTASNLMFYTVPVNFMEQSELELFMQDVAADRPRCVVVDTVARSMGGYDENSTRDMNQFVSRVDYLARTLNVGVLLIHHTNKQGIMRGSSSLFAACDSILFLTRSDTRMSLHNNAERGGKNKFCTEEKSRYLTLRQISVTYGGETHDEAVIVPAEKVFQAEGDDLTETQEIIMLALDGTGEGLTGKETVFATELPQATVYRALKQLQQMQLVSRSDDRYSLSKTGKERLNQQ